VETLGIGIVVAMGLSFVVLAAIWWVWFRRQGPGYP
jgi:hypothetical protein